MSQLHFDGIGMTSKRTRDRLIQRLEERGIRNRTVLQVMAETPRHWFLDEALAHRAYEDTALPIGHGQTLSQPYTVARMTELLLEHCATPRRILEIGTGSGYQTSILARLFERVWTLERIRPLQNKARNRLNQLRLYNIHYKYADGALGWPEAGPFDAILSAASPVAIPEALLAQLAPGGALVSPVGTEVQQLVLVQRHADTGRLTTRAVESARFVPLLPGVVDT